MAKSSGCGIRVKGAEGLQAALADLGDRFRHLGVTMSEALSPIASFAAAARAAEAAEAADRRREEEAVRLFFEQRASRISREELLRTYFTGPAPQAAPQLPAYRRGISLSGIPR